MILFILSVIGMTHILVRSEIIEPVEKLAAIYLPTKIHHGLFECFQCAGFWCGAILSLLLISWNPVTIFAFACAGSFLADFSETLFRYLEATYAHDDDPHF